MSTLLHLLALNKDFLATTPDQAMDDPHLSRNVALGGHGTNPELNFR